MPAHATDAITPAASATEEESSGRARRCINRSCGRYLDKVRNERRCVSCGRSMKPALLAPLIAAVRRRRR